MPDLTLTRRSAALGLTATAFTGLARIGAASASTSRAVGYGPLERDPAGLLDLPRGFSYRVLSAHGDPMDDGLVVPDHADGMGCIALHGGRHALIRNHELSPQHAGRGAFGGGHGAGAAFDRDGSGDPLPGGTTTLVIDDASGHLVVCEDQYTETVANRLIGVTPAGQTYVLGFLRAQTELAGACFSPDGRTLYVNTYSPARTLAITMPAGADA